MKSRIPPHQMPKDEDEDEGNESSDSGLGKLKRIVREFWEPHPEAMSDPDRRAPAVAVIATGDGWDLYIHPANALNEKDRAAVWADLDRAAREVIAEALPEVTLRVVPPETFPNGQTMCGIVHFTCPGAWSPTAANYWFDQISMECPAISVLCSHYLAERAREHGGYLTARGYRPHIASQRPERKRNPTRRTPPRRGQPPRRQ